MRVPTSRADHRYIPQTRRRAPSRSCYRKPDGHTPGCVVHCKQLAQRYDVGGNDAGDSEMANLEGSVLNVLAGAAVGPNLTPVTSCGRVRPPWSFIAGRTACESD